MGNLYYQNFSLSNQNLKSVVKEDKYQTTRIHK